MGAHSHTCNGVHHLPWCDKEKTNICSCPWVRYVLATIFGIVAAIMQGFFAFIAQSAEAMSDAGHALADSLAIAPVAFLAYRMVFASSEKSYKIDRIGIIWNTVFLFGISITLFFWFYLVVSTLHYERIILSSWMFVSGIIGLIGNIYQHKVLGHDHGGDVSTHSTTKQHILYDIIYSFLVLYGAGLIFSAENTEGLMRIFSMTGIILVGYILARHFFFDEVMKNKFIISVVNIILIFLVVSGRGDYVDAFLTFVLAVAMFVTAYKNTKSLF